MEIVVEEHKMNLSELYQMLGTNPDSGLSVERARAILKRDGPNKIPPPETTPNWIKFLKQLFTGYSPLLWIGAVVCFVAYAIQAGTSEDPLGDNLYMAIVLTVVVIVTGCFSFYQELKTSVVVDPFEDMDPKYAVVIRGGDKQTIASEEVVAGDIVEVKFGDKIPADIRIISADGFKVDHSSLTGESEPVSKTTEFTDENPLETSNLAFFTTDAVEGTCRGLVLRTGARTVMGQLAKSNVPTVLDVGDSASPGEIDQFVHTVKGMAALLWVTYFVVTFALGYGRMVATIIFVGIVMADALISQLMRRHRARSESDRAHME